VDDLQISDKLSYDYSNWPDEVKVIPIYPITDICEFVKLVQFQNIFSNFYFECSASKKVNLLFHILIDDNNNNNSMFVIPVDDVSLEPTKSKWGHSFKDIVVSMCHAQIAGLFQYQLNTEYKIVGIKKLEILQQANVV
jgi:hypothetical protein